MIFYTQHDFRRPGRPWVCCESGGTDKVGSRYYVRFACPFVQKRLFNYFAGAIFQEMGQLFGPFKDLADTITDIDLNIANLLQRYKKLSEKEPQLVVAACPTPR